VYITLSFEPESPNEPVMFWNFSSITEYFFSDIVAAGDSLKRKRDSLTFLSFTVIE
jgi:hypothetical protein